VIQGEPVAGLRRAVPGQAVAGDRRGQRRGGQRGGTGVHPVQQDRDPARRRAEHEAGQRRVLQAAERGQHPDRVGRVQLLPGQRHSDQIDLASQRHVVDAGAAAGRGPRADAGEGADQRGRGGRVGDAHVAGQQAAVPVGDQLPSGVDADLDGGGGLLAGERRAAAEVRGAVGHPPRHQPRRRVERAGHTDVDHAHLRADPAGEGVHHRAAGQEVGDHLCGHLLRPRGDALRVHPVVGGEDGHRGRLGQRRRAGPGDPGQRDRHLLQLPQRPRRLGHPVQPLRRGRRGGGIRVDDGRHRGRQQRAHVGSAHSAPPRPVRAGGTISVDR
jgi:hypothetical protein